MSATPRPLWKHVLDEAVLGNRGLAKLNGLWFPLAAYLTARPPASSRTASAAFFLAAVAVACWILSAVIANDIADSDVDGVEKRRWVNRLPRATGIVFVAALAAASLAVPVLAGAGPAVVLLMTAGTALGLAYSTPPLRLKERGAAGVFAYSSSCALVYAFVPGVWLGGRGAELALVAAAVFLDKWTNLLFHQVLDLGDDGRAGVRTYAVRAGADRARRELRVAAWLAALAAAAAGVRAITLLDHGWRAAVLAATGAACLGAGLFAGRRRGPAGPSPLARELPAVYLALTYGVFRACAFLLLAALARAGTIAWSAPAAAAALSAVEAASLLRSPGHLRPPSP